MTCKFSFSGLSFLNATKFDLMLSWGDIRGASASQTAVISLHQHFMFNWPWLLLLHPCTFSLFSCLSFLLISEQNNHNQKIRSSKLSRHKYILFVTMTEFATLCSLKNGNLKTNGCFNGCYQVDHRNVLSFANPSLENNGRKHSVPKNMFSFIRIISLPDITYHTWSEYDIRYIR